MDFDITVGKSVGKIEFGASRGRVRDIMGLPFAEFRKNEFSVNTTDDYGFCHVYYDADNACAAVEFIEKTVLKLNGEDIFSMDYDDLSKYIMSLDNEAVRDADGITSEKLSLSAYAPDKKTESILVAKNGYYD